MQFKGRICTNVTMYICKRDVMLTAFSMAFYRANISATPLINNVYCKCSINTLKLYPSKRQLSTKSKHSNHKRARNDTKSLEEDKRNTLSRYIKERKLEAQRSIIVQVAAWNSCKDLVSYCNRFGEIANVYFYALPKEHKFVLLEYKSESCAKDVINSATYMDKEHIVPGRTNVMWFRKAFNKEPHLNLRSNLPHVNDNSTYMLLQEAVIRNSLMFASSVSSQMSILYNEYKIGEVEVRLKFQIINNLEKYFSGIFPSIVVHPFGSFINGFGKKLSDLDVVLFAGGHRKEDLSSRLVFHCKTTNVDEKQHTHEFMGVLADTMKYIVPGICNVRKIFNARVPIIKFNNVFTNTECDLSISNIIAIHMSELLYLYGELDDRVRPLVFTIRRWAHDNKLTSIHPGQTITNFSLTLLIIFYLQQEHILPPINVMEDFAEIKRFNTNQLYAHRMRPHWIRQENSDELDVLLLNFFKFYFDFNFNNDSICLRAGCALKKSAGSALHIHNPFNKELNVSKNVSLNEVQRIKSLMRIAISNLENTVSNKSKNWGILSILSFPERPKPSIDASLILRKDNESTEKLKEVAKDDETIIQNNNNVNTGIGAVKQV